MLLDDLAAKLVAEGVVTATSIFTGANAAIPTGNGPYVTLIETGGLAPMRGQNNTPIRRPGVQVTCRAADYKVARAMAETAYAALDGKFNISLSGTFYVKITARQEPTGMGLDNNKRPIIVFNLDIEKRT